MPEGLDLKMERAEKEEKQARKRERRSLIGSEMFKRYRKGQYETVHRDKEMKR